MSKYFVDDPPVPVYEFDATEFVSSTPPNVIWIRAKMDTATSGKVKSELLRFGADGQTPELHVGENETALLVHNIVRWEGPDLGGVPCTPERIRAMDPTEPHFAKVLEEIAKRNKKRVSPNPKSATASSNTSAGERPLTISESLVLGNGTPRSPLQNAITGHRERSENSTPIT